MLISFISNSEETSNNRIRSGPLPRQGPRPIDQVPAAGARQGLPNGIETTEAGIAVADLEDPERSPGLRPLSFNDSTSTVRPRSSSPVGSDIAPYMAGGGGLLLSPASDGRRTPTTASGLLSPHQISSLSA